MSAAVKEKASACYEGRPGRDIQPGEQPMESFVKYRVNEIPNYVQPSL